jgi:hypothetical protein
MGIATGECSGEPLIGVRGAIMPSSAAFLFDPPRILGSTDSNGASMDLTRDVDDLPLDCR